MFEEISQNSPENERNSYENNLEELQETRDKKLEEFYKNIKNIAERHKAEFHSASLNVLGGIGGIFEKMGK